MKILREGDTGMALAPGRGRVQVVYKYQDLVLDSGTVVKDVLVGVDAETGEVLVVPAQSTPKIHAARRATKDETFSVRIPRELYDVLWLVSAKFDVDPSRFTAPLILFYLNEALENASLARRLARLSMEDLASKEHRSRLTVRSDATLVDRLKRIEEEHSASRSEFVRGALMAAKEDVLDGRAKRRTERLQAIAEAT